MRAIEGVKAAGLCNWKQKKFENMGGTEDGAHISGLSNEGHVDIIICYSSYRRDDPVCCRK